MALYDSIELSPDQSFNLDLSLACGQVFRWICRDGWWYGISRDRVMKIRQNGNILHFEWVDEELIRDYFQLDRDIREIEAAIRTDPVMHTAIDACRGLRIINQDPWECLVFQMCVTRNRLQQSKDRITRIAENLGKRVYFEGRPYYTFPSAEAIIERGLRGLKGCNIGYLAENIFLAADLVIQDDRWTDRIRSVPYDVARAELAEMKGIKPGVADWILLLGFQRYEAFPADAHIRSLFMRAYMNEVHFQSTDAQRIDEAIRKEAQKKFGNYAGYAFEYLFTARNEIEKLFPEV